MKQDLTIIEEVDLEKFVTQAKHNGVPSLKPLFDEDKIIVFLVLQFFNWSIFELFIEVDHESFKKHILLLEVSILWHSIRFVGLDILLLKRWVFHEVNISI
jgi:hypothetical protein